MDNDLVYEAGLEAQNPRPLGNTQQLATFTSPEAKRALARFLNAVARGALTGLCLKGGLNLVGLLLAVISRRSRARRSSSLSFSEAIADTRRYTTFLGAFSGVVVAVDEGIAALFGKQRYDACGNARQQDQACSLWHAVKHD